MCLQTTNLAAGGLIRDPWPSTLIKKSQRKEHVDISEIVLLLLLYPATTGYHVWWVLCHSSAKSTNIQRTCSTLARTPRRLPSPKPHSSTRSNRTVHTRTRGYRHHCPIVGQNPNSGSIHNIVAASTCSDSEQSIQEPFLAEPTTHTLPSIVFYE